MRSKLHIIIMNSPFAGKRSPQLFLEESLQTTAAVCSEGKSSGLCSMDA